MRYLHCLRQKLNGSIFLCVIVTFLIVMVPIFALGVYIYYWGVATVRNEISKSTTMQVTFYLR